MEELRRVQRRPPAREVRRDLKNTAAVVPRRHPAREVRREVRKVVH